MSKHLARLAAVVVFAAAPGFARAEDLSQRQNSPVTQPPAEISMQSESVQSEPVQDAQSAAEPPSAWNWELRSLVQVDWVVRRQSSVDAIDTTSGRLLNDQRFLLRRARLRLQGERQYLGGWFELDANTTEGVQIQPFEAGLAGGWPTGLAAQRAQVSGGSDWAKPRLTSATAPAISVAAGLIRVPFGFETQEALTRRPWLERARFATAFFGQARDLGATFSAAYDVARLEVGVANGSPLGTNQHSLLEPDRGKDWMGRLGVDWPMTPGLRLEAGWSWLTGSDLSLGSAQTKDTVVWVDDNENGLVEVVELSPAPGVPAVPSATYQHNAVGADLRLTWANDDWGDLQLRGEVVRALNLDRTLEPADPVRLGRNVRQLGYVLGARYEWGHLVWAAARYDVYDPDADAARQEVATLVPADRTYRSLSLTVGVRLWGARLMCQYDAEDNTLGRDASGRPTTLNDDRLTARAEVTFP